MRIEELRIKNYRALQDVSLVNVPQLSVFLGPNGAGKSTLFDVFGFLRDSLLQNVQVAVDKRGGYSELITRGTRGPIEILVKFRQTPTEAIPNPPLATYELQIVEQDGNVVVSKEMLKYRRGSHGQPWKFLDFAFGKGSAVTNEADLEQASSEEEREEQALDSPSTLAIKGLGQFQRFAVVRDFRKLVESWHVSDFHIADARRVGELGVAEHLSSSGDNIAMFAKHLHDRHPKEFQRVLDVMKQRIPGVASVSAEKTIDGRLVLRFQDGSFKDPFVSHFVSDGTIKMFAYLLLLHDPSPHPLLCVEEPENQLYPQLLLELAEEFQQYAVRGGQVFVSTHSPDFIDALSLESLWYLNKENGVTKVRRLKDDEQIAAFLSAGDSLGSLFRQQILERNWSAMQ